MKISFQKLCEVLFWTLLFASIPVLWMLGCAFVMWSFELFSMTAMLYAVRAFALVGFIVGIFFANRT